MRKALMRISFLVAILFAAGAIAQDMPFIQKSFQAIKVRIDSGMRDGTLSRQQVAKLDKEVNQIEARIRQVRDDSVATKSERQSLRDVLARVERDLEAAGAITQDMSAIQKRSQVIQERIDFGMRDGTLSRQQVAKLDKDENQIEAMIRKARADGTAYKSERQPLRDVLSRVERDLEKMRVRQR